ncbi:MAG TPA: calcium-binding protein [Tepidisphaeraceae bacterium]|jgi:Ca2+-binding RTX toxin-like protein|nr:calcium-binding protein [Tepidisphaeraceae bacterium]
MLERLEMRQLLSVTTTYSNHVLTITGDANANVINLSRTTNTNELVVKSGDTTIRTVAYNDVEKIYISLLGGNDVLNTAGSIGKGMNVIGGEGNDTLRGGSGPDLIKGNTGNDSEYGNGGNDQLFGDEDQDLLDGGTGADRISGGTGNDNATYATRTTPVTVTIDGVANDGTPASGTTPGEGDNVLTDVENLTGGFAGDKLTGSSAANIIYGAGGADQINGLDGNDNLIGGGGNDTIHGNAGGDKISGGSDNDQLFGDAGRDSIDGGSGADLLSGGDDNDWLYTKDGVKDSVLGGGGTEDRASVDTIDSWSGVEIFI